MLRCSVVVFALLLPLAAHAQLETLPMRTDSPNLLTTPTLTPGAKVLYDLETRFSADVAEHGGKAFAKWFAEDAITLNNGKPAVLGQPAIAAGATWDPKVYRLTWKPEGAQMFPTGDAGFTWGHYEGTSKDSHGQPVTVEGRYFTMWRKVGDAWKVAMDGGANEPPGAGDCCALPKP